MPKTSQPIIIPALFAVTNVEFPLIVAVCSSRFSIAEMVVWKPAVYLNQSLQNISRLSEVRHVWARGVDPKHENMKSYNNLINISPNGKVKDTCAETLLISGFIDQNITSNDARL